MSTLCINFDFISEEVYYAKWKEWDVSMENWLLSNLVSAFSDCFGTAVDGLSGKLYAK